MTRNEHYKQPAQPGNGLGRGCNPGKEAGQRRKTEGLYAQALELELDAIRELEEGDDRPEPTWSVLHRSAGWIALNSNQPRLAEKLACTALAGEPHPEIAAELRNLLAAAHQRMGVKPDAAQQKEGVAD